MCRKKFNKLKCTFALNIRQYYPYGNSITGERHKIIKIIIFSLGAKCYTAST